MKEPTPKIRVRLIQRDGEHCRYCHAESDLTIEHILPKCRGGRNLDISNLCLLCKKCNNDKGPLTEAEYLKVRHDSKALAKARLYINSRLDPGYQKSGSHLQPRRPKGTVQLSADIEIPEDFLFLTYRQRRRKKDRLKKEALAQSIGTPEQWEQIEQQQSKKPERPSGVYFRICDFPSNPSK